MRVVHNYTIEFMKLSSIKWLKLLFLDENE